MSSFRRHEPVDRQRRVAALLSACVAVGAAFLALGPLSNLWADYQDSPTWVYVLAGGPFAAVSIAALVGAVLLLRRK
jgi:hypothetical protein